VTFILKSFVLLATIFASSIAAKGQAVVDFNAPMPAFSEADYQRLLQCSLERHPELTRRYAEFYLLRRDNQTSEENTLDPDSGLLLKAWDGCYTSDPGVIPFNINALILDWGIAHGFERIKVTNLDGMADCISNYAADHIDRVLIASSEIEKIVAFRNFQVAMCDFSGLAKFDRSDMDEVISILRARKSASEVAE
jgi:hypothetical protein